MASEHQLKQWRKELLADFKHCDPYFIDLVLDLYKHNPDYVKKLPKRKFKEVKQDLPREIVGACSVINNPDDEFISKYFKPPITLTEEEAQA